MAVPTLYTYTLQTNETAAGRMTVKLYSEFSGLTLPTYSSLYYEETNERYDAIPNSIELEEMICQFEEDYSTYQEGFWYKVLGGYAEIQFLLDDGYGDSHFFWGRVTGQAAQLEELAIVQGIYLRRGEFRLVSLLVKLKETTIVDALTEADTHKITRIIGVTSSYYCSVYAIIASIIKVGFNQSYSVGDITKQVDDMQFYDGSTWWGSESVHVYAGATTVGAFAYYLDLTGMAWSREYTNSFELLNGLCETFHLVPRYYYDVSAGRHKIELLTRGRSYATSTFESPFESMQITQAYPIRKVMTSARFTMDGTGLPSTPADKRYYFDGLYNTDGLPIGVESEQDVLQQFILKDTEEAYGSNGQYFLWTSLDPITRISDTRVWDYAAGAMTTSTYTMLRYAVGRFGQNKRAYQRTYLSLKADDGSTNSQANNYALRTISIPDELTTRTFYAVEVTKNVVKNECTILWHEV